VVCDGGGFCEGVVRKEYTSTYMVQCIKARAPSPLPTADAASSILYSAHGRPPTTRVVLSGNAENPAHLDSGTSGAQGRGGEIRSFVQVHWAASIGTDETQRAWTKAVAGNASAVSEWRYPVVNRVNTRCNLGSHRSGCSTNRVGGTVQI
jgi:hypothetical protein